MDIVEVIRLACYVVNIIASFTLAGYFLREYMSKKLRASFAWGLGFTLLGFVIVTQVFLFAVQVSRSLIMIGIIFASIVIALLYYGTSLLFFSEGSFFREKMTAIYFFLMLLVGEVVSYIAPEERIIEYSRGSTAFIYTFVYFLIGILFYRVSRRIPKEDLRRRTISLVSVAWFIIGIWMIYQGLYWGEYPMIEAGVFLFGSLGFLLLLYGMTTGKTARK